MSLVAETCHHIDFIPLPNRPSSTGVPPPACDHPRQRLPWLHPTPSHEQLLPRDGVPLCRCAPVLQLLARAVGPTGKVRVRLAAAAASLYLSRVEKT